MKAIVFDYFATLSDPSVEPLRRSTFEATASALGVPAAPAHDRCDIDSAPDRVSHCVCHINHEAPSRLTGMEVELVEGDITAQRVDVIVNAANSSLLGGGGVDGAIHRKGGPAILEDCRALRASKFGRGLATGQAVATTAGNLPARWVVHTVGPVFSASEDRSPLLRACYENSLRVAGELGAATIAFPLISSGIYRWPVDDAVLQALAVLRSADPPGMTGARLVLFGHSVYTIALGVNRDAQ
jgi:O-acetyl-ADP-ribose deacetylase (regulator of RNase III)